MDPATMAMIGSTAASTLGGLFGGDKKKNKTTIDFLNKPQMQRVQEGADVALSEAERMGPYQGDYYAGFNPLQRDAVQRTAGFSDANAGLGQGLVFDGQALKDQGLAIGSNAQSIFDQAMSRSPEAAREAAMGEATGGRTQSLIDAALRDTTRQLTEQTLPGIQDGITATGNRNSSRAGAAEAVATRGAQDRMADVSAQIRQNAYDQALSDDYRRTVSNDQLALGSNSQLGSVYDRGVGTIQTGINTEQGLNSSLMGAGTALQGNDQLRLEADRARFDDMRFDGFNILDRYNQTIGGPQGIQTGQTGTATLSQNPVQQFGQNTESMQGAFSAINNIGKMFKPEKKP